MLGEFLVGQLLCSGRCDWVFIGSEKCSQGRFFLCGTGEELFSRLIWVEYDKVITRKVDLQANDVRDLLVDMEVKNSPDCF